MAHQIYFTHCLLEDSVKHQAGFSIRATSTKDAELLQFASEYPAYELPIDMWNLNPTPAQAPRRLAFVPGPKQTQVLIHTSYLGSDTKGRTGNFFSHLIFYDRLTTIQALQSWGAAEWKTGYPQGAPKQLNPLADAPIRGNIFSRETLQAFLSGGGMPGNDGLATLLRPDRLQNGEAATALLERTIQAYLLASQQEASGQRDKLYLLGEPGLIALLLYGLVTVLPPTTVERISFSTFEPAHRSLRQIKSSQVVGTYLHQLEKGLEQDYLLRRGFGIDTFRLEKSSPELQEEAMPFISELVTKAAQGQWDFLELFHSCHSGPKVTDHSIALASELTPFLQRANLGQLQLDELLDVPNHPERLELLESNLRIFWKYLRNWSQQEERIYQSFPKLYQQCTIRTVNHLAKLLTASTNGARSVDDPDVNLLRHILTNNEETLVQVVCHTLQHLQPEPRFRLIQTILKDQTNTVEMLERIFTHGVTLDPKAVNTLLDSISGKGQPQRVWLESNIIAAVLTQVSANGEAALPIWERFCQSLNVRVLMKAQDQEALLKKLFACRTKLGPAVPTKIAQQLDDWAQLRQWFHSPDRCESVTPEELDATCERLGMKKHQILWDYFQTLIVDKEPTSPEAKQFLRSVTLATRSDASYESYCSSLDVWLAIVNKEKDHDQRAGFQRLFFEQEAPAEFHPQLAEYRQKKLRPPVYRDLMRQSLNPKEQASVDSIPDEEESDSLDNGNGKQRIFASMWNKPSPVLMASLVANVVLLIVGICFGMWISSGNNSNSENKNTPEAKNKQNSNELAEDNDEKVIRKTLKKVEGQIESLFPEAFKKIVTPELKNANPNQATELLIAEIKKQKDELLRGKRKSDALLELTNKNFSKVEKEFEEYKGKVTLDEKNRKKQEAKEKLKLTNYAQFQLLFAPPSLWGNNVRRLLYEYPAWESEPSPILPKE